MYIMTQDDQYKYFDIVEIDTIINYTGNVTSDVQASWKKYKLHKK